MKGAHEEEKAAKAINKQMGELHSLTNFDIKSIRNPKMELKKEYPMDFNMCEIRNH
jgi:hypothetical protein